MQKMYTKKIHKMYKCTQKNPSCTEVYKTYRMYIEVMYNVQNVHTGRPGKINNTYTCFAAHIQYQKIILKFVFENLIRLNQA